MIDGSDDAPAPPPARRRKIGRPLRPPETVADVTLTVRLTTAERAGLERLVVRRQAELLDSGAVVTAGSVVRALIRRELDAEGQRSGPAPAVEAPAPAPVVAAPPPVEAAPPKPRKAPAKPTTSGGPSPEAVRRVLVRRFDAGEVKLRPLAASIGVDSAQLTRFKGGEGFPPARLPALAAALGVKP